jgi:chromate reductase, NAD(P)H dehydrogenase (quinone)
MIEVIVGTDRPNSNTGKVARFVLELYQAENIKADLIDLNALDFRDIAGGDYYKGARGGFAQAVERVSNAQGVVFVVPEYNGSFPGALKLFIDYWRYPETFENRPFAFVGLGGRWGGMRPVEHLQQVVGFRNAYCFPHRVFLNNVKETFKDGKVTDPLILDLLKTQTREFAKFIKGLQSQGLDANSKLGR